MTVHSDEKPFKCDICDVVFKRMDSLRRHQRKKTHENQKRAHKKQSGDLVCECGYVARDKNRLASHTHRQHKCDECESTFQCNNGLKNHMMRDHIGQETEGLNNPDVISQQRDIACECGYITSLYKLSKHRSKIRNCNRCDSTFRCKGSLKKHNQEVHNASESNIPTQLSHAAESNHAIPVLDYSMKHMKKENSDQLDLKTEEPKMLGLAYPNDRVSVKLAEINSILQIINKLVE